MTTSETPPGYGTSDPRTQPSEVVVDFDRMESLAAVLIEVIHDHAATWETDFDAGPGDVVSVKDAAWVISKHLLTTADPMTTCPNCVSVVDALRRVMANEGNHYDRYWTPPPEPVTDEWLADTEAKMREALTDAFCDDAAAIMLTLVTEIRRLRNA